MLKKKKIKQFVLLDIIRYIYSRSKKQGGEQVGEHSKRENTILY